MYTFDDIVTFHNDVFVVNLPSLPGKPGSPFIPGRPSPGIPGSPLAPGIPSRPGGPVIQKIVFRNKTVANGYRSS